jgi:succinyl-diaminopimelate desuccinylase
MADLRATLLGWIDQDQDNILQFMQTMVHTRSPNPPGDTRAVMALVRSYLDRSGLAYAMVNRDETMPNLVATQAFAVGSKHLVLNGHIDVFPVETSEGWSQDPWDGHVDGTIWGRGSADMKVGTTASILTYVYLSRFAQHFAGKLTLTVVSEEESFGPNGARHLFDVCPELIMGTALLNGEPSGASVVRFGEKGALWLRITVQTAGGHGAYPHLSPNAIEKAFELITDLKTLGQTDFEEPDVVVAALERSRADYDRAYGEGASDLARKVTMNIGTISGGSRVNMIASRCTFDVDIRLPNGADADDMLARIEALRDRHQFTYEVLLLNRPNWADPNDELALIVADTADAVTGIRPVPAVSLGNTDARLWRYRNIPSVVYGPSPRGMGSTNEHVPTAEALNVVRCHVLSAAAYLLRKA